MPAFILYQINILPKSIWYNANENFAIGFILFTLQFVCRIIARFTYFLNHISKKQYTQVL